MGIRGGVAGWGREGSVLAAFDGGEEDGGGESDAAVDSAGGIWGEVDLEFEDEGVEVLSDGGDGYALDIDVIGLWDEVGEETSEGGFEPAIFGDGADGLVVWGEDFPFILEDAFEAPAAESADLGATGGVVDVVGGGEVDDLSGLDDEEFSAHGFVGVDADVFFEFEGSHFGVADDAIHGVVDVEGTAEDFEDFAADGVLRESKEVAHGISRVKGLVIEVTRRGSMGGRQGKVNEGEAEIVSGVRGAGR